MRTLTTLCALPLLLLLIPLAAAAQDDLPPVTIKPNKKVERQLDKGFAKRGAGNLDKAAHHFQRAMDLSLLSDPRPFLELAETYLAMGEWERGTRTALRTLDVTEEPQFAQRAHLLSARGLIGWYRQLAEGGGDLPADPALLERAARNLRRVIDGGGAAALEARFHLAEAFALNDETAAARGALEGYFEAAGAYASPEAQELARELGMGDGAKPSGPETKPSGPKAKETEPVGAPAPRTDDEGPGLVERPDWGRFFEEAGVEGTIVIRDLSTGRTQVYDPERAATRFLPASTFKIPNSLISLETGVVHGTDEVLPWDGEERWVKAWNRDHDMASAIEVSAVWFYQELARRVGEERMRLWLERLGYGNRDVGGGIDRFWLDGDLAISPLEQVDFLSRLARRELPFSAETTDAVHRILVSREDADQAPGRVLRAKTGWAVRGEGPQIGWWVGWVTHADGRTYVFATNLTIEDEENDVAARKGVTRAILAAEGI